MFGVDTTELLIIAVAALIFIGPKDLPRVMRTIGYWIGRARGMARHFTAGVETMMREAELEDMEKKWRGENERIMRDYPPTGDYPDPPPPPLPPPDAGPIEDDDPRPPSERPLP